MSANPAWTYRQFVSAWQNSHRVSEVATTLGITTKLASHIAARLRKRGVPLRYFKRGTRTEERMGNDTWQSLAKLCEAKHGSANRKSA